METAFEKHMTAIRNGSVAKSNVTGLRKLLNAMGRISQGYSVSHQAEVNEIDHADAQCLFKLLAARKPRVTGELLVSGLGVLSNPRNRKAFLVVSDMVPEVDSFRLVGFRTIGDGGPHYTPVYRACTPEGPWFEFTNVPWQSGGRGPHVLGWLSVP